MRFKILFACMIAGSLWASGGYADIYVWVDKDAVMHYSNENPPPHAEIFMPTKEIAPAESDDPSIREAEWPPEGLQAQTLTPADELRFIDKQAGLLQPFDKAQQYLGTALSTPTVMGDQENTITELQAESQRTITGADHAAEAAPQRTAELAKTRGAFPYLRVIAMPHLRTPTTCYHSPGRIFHHKAHQFRKKRHQFLRHHFNSRHDFRERSRGSKRHQRGFHLGFRTHRHAFLGSGVKPGRVSRFRNHSSRQTRFSGHPQHAQGYESLF